MSEGMNESILKCLGSEETIAKAINLRFQKLSAYLGRRINVSLSQRVNNRVPAVDAVIGSSSSLILP